MCWQQKIEEAKMWRKGQTKHEHKNYLLGHCSHILIASQETASSYYHSLPFGKFSKRCFVSKRIGKNFDREIFTPWKMSISKKMKIGGPRELEPWLKSQKTKISERSQIHVQIFLQPEGMGIGSQWKLINRKISPLNIISTHIIDISNAFRWIPSVSKFVL